MIDWGTWVIVAAIAWPDGHTDCYHPQTLLDEPACIATAKQINHRWHDAHIVGFATCQLAQGDR